LNLEAPKPGRSASSLGTTATESIPLPNADPAKVEAIRSRAKDLLDAGRIPEWLFACRVANGLLMLKAPAGPVMLLFSSPFAASDYLRATSTQSTAGQFNVQALPELTQSWLSSGIQTASLDRCPRCTHCLSIPLGSMAKWSTEDFAKIWAHHRATRLVMSEIQIRSAMNHSAAGSHAETRRDLEYLRDHFDCGLPYLHQVIGLLAGAQGDEAAKAASLERLREFGPQFACPLDFSPELLATAMVGLMTNFGIVPKGKSDPVP
jgi:hypothetical protein